ncbi:MAG: hypothetical protein ACLSUW_05000 [Akkermansia sp.]
MPRTRPDWTRAELRYQAWRRPAVIHGTANHPNLVARLEIVADKNKIPLQHEAAGRRTGTDTDISTSPATACLRAGVRPLRYMHSRWKRPL